MLQASSAGVHSPPYCSSAAVLSGDPDCLPSSNPVVRVLSLQSEISMDKQQVTCTHMIIA